MKLIYKLPQYLAVIVACVTIGIILSDIKAAKSANFFELIEAGNNIKESSPAILGIDVYWILMIIGLIITIIVAYLRREIYGINSLASFMIAVVFFLQAFLGAKLLCGIEMVITDRSFDSFDMSGQSLYGTIFISFLFIPILSKILKMDTWALYDYVAPFWAILLIFVRTGCYFHGCCGADACLISGVELILPVQLFEVIIDLIILQIVFNIENRNIGSSENERKTGNSFFMMIALYGLFRFMLEFIRNNTIIWIGMTFGQIYSVICIVIAICAMMKEKKQIENG